MDKLHNDFSMPESQRIISSNRFKSELSKIVRDFISLLLKETKDKKLDMKEQLKGYGISKKLFQSFLKIYGEKGFIDRCIPYLIKDIEINLEKGLIQSIEFYEDKEHYAEISKIEDGDYLIQKFKKGKDYRVKK